MRKIVLGTDWWTDCDDAVALRLICRAIKNRSVQLLGIGINACMEYSVASLKGFLKEEGIEDIPVGIDLDAIDFGGNPPYQKRLAEAFCPNACNSDAEDAVRLYRRLLAAEKGKLEIIEIGYPQVLANLLKSGADDISEKLLCWTKPGDEKSRTWNEWLKEEKGVDVFVKRTPNKFYLFFGRFIFVIPDIV